MRVALLRASSALLVCGLFSVAMVFGQTMAPDVEGSMIGSSLLDVLPSADNGQDNYYTHDEAGSDCDCPRCVAACVSAPVWYVGAEAMFLNRTRSDQIKIAEFGRPTSSSGGRGEQPAALTTHDLDFDYEWGPRITVGRYLDACRAVEARYYGLNYWKATADIPINGRTDIPFDWDTGDFDGIRSGNVTYRSEFHNAEVNFLRKRNACFTTLWGIRYINLLDEFDLESTDDSTSHYLIDAENHMIGTQFGGIYTRPITERLSLDVTGAGGLYVNFARQRTGLLDNDGASVESNYDIHHGELAFAGELRLGLLYRLTSRFSVTAGYQVLWLEGVALAPEQLNFGAMPLARDLNDNGSAFLDGGYIGLQMEI